MLTDDEIERMYVKEKRYFASYVKCLGGGYEVEDVLQTAFMRAVEYKAQCRINPRNWLIKIIISVCLDLRRREHLRKEVIFFPREIMETTFMEFHDFEKNLRIRDAMSFIPPIYLNDIMFWANNEDLTNTQRIRAKRGLDLARVRSNYKKVRKGKKK